MHGLGKALPKGSTVLMPFNFTVNVGELLYGTTSYSAFVVELQAAMAKLGAQETPPAWE